MVELYQRLIQIAPAFVLGSLKLLESIPSIDDCYEYEPRIYKRGNIDESDLDTYKKFILKSSYTRLIRSFTIRGFLLLRRIFSLVGVLLVKGFPIRFILLFVIWCNIKGFFSLPYIFLSLLRLLILCFCCCRISRFSIFFWFRVWGFHGFIFLRGVIIEICIFCFVNLIIDFLFFFLLLYFDLWKCLLL